MLAKRIIPCLDVRDGKVTKGVQFLANIDVGDPVAMARYYYEQGADEIVFYDITASNERRGIMLDVVRAVAREIFIPFSVGGGLRTLDDMRARIRQPVRGALDAGEKYRREPRNSHRLPGRHRWRTSAYRPRRAGLVARGRTARRRRALHQLDRSRRHQTRLRSRPHAPDQRGRFDSRDRVGRCR